MYVGWRGWCDWCWLGSWDYLFKYILPSLPIIWNGIEYSCTRFFHVFLSLTWSHSLVCPQKITHVTAVTGRTTKEEGTACTCHLNLWLFFPLSFPALLLLLLLSFHSRVKKRLSFRIALSNTAGYDYHHACLWSQRRLRPWCTSRCFPSQSIGF